MRTGVDRGRKTCQQGVGTVPENGAKGLENRAKIPSSGLCQARFTRTYLSADGVAWVVSPTITGGMGGAADAQATEKVLTGLSSLYFVDTPCFQRRIIKN